MTRHNPLNNPFKPSNRLLQRTSHLSHYILPIIMILFIVTPVWANTNDQIADAIFKSEGGMKAQYWYGIRSVKYDSLKEARRICLNTIRNQRKRHAKHSHDLTYLECLASRYAPRNVSNDPRNLNRYWLSNVLYFLNKGDK